MNELNQTQSIPDPLLPLTEVLMLIRVAPSTWWSGVASGKFPPPDQMWSPVALATERHSKLY
jgi:hypothetical protein